MGRDLIKPHILVVLRALVVLVGFTRSVMAPMVALGHRFSGLFLKHHITKQPLVVGNHYKQLVIVTL